MVEYFFIREENSYSNYSFKRIISWIKFELNVFKPLIAHNILQSIDLLADSSKNFALYCIKGLKADKEKIKYYLENSLMLVIRYFTPSISKALTKFSISFVISYSCTLLDSYKNL